MMSLAILKESWAESSKQFSSKALANEYLISFRKNNEKVDIELNGQINHIDDVALSYLMLPKFKSPILATALLVRNGISGEFIKILSNIIPKDLLSTILITSKKNLSYQYKRKSLNNASSHNQGF